MKTNIISTIIIVLALSAMSCVFTSCNKPKLDGTTWRMHEEVQGLDDAPTLTFDRTLKFVDKSAVEIYDINESSGYSSSYVNNEGTVDYHPGGKTEEAKKGTYTFENNVLTITIGDKKERYIIRKDYLIYDIDEKEYDELPDYQRGLYTYKRFK